MERNHPNSPQNIKAALTRVNNRVVKILQREPVFYALNFQRLQSRYRHYVTSGLSQRDPKQFEILQFPHVTSPYHIQNELPLEIRRAFRIFHLKEHATLADVKKIRNHLIKQCHPDYVGNHAKGQRLSQMILENYQILSQHFQKTQTAFSLGGRSTAAKIRRRYQLS